MFLALFTGDILGNRTSKLVTIIEILLREKDNKQMAEYVICPKGMEL